MTEYPQKRSKAASISVALIIIGCVAIAGVLIAKSLRQSTPKLAPIGPSGLRGPALGGDFADRSIPRYRGAVTAINTTAGSITITPRDQPAMTFTTTNTTKILVKRQVAPLSDIQVGYRAVILSKDGKTALDIASGPRRLRGAGGPGGGGFGGGQGGGLAAGPGGFGPGGGFGPTPGGADGRQSGGFGIDQVGRQATPPSANQKAVPAAPLSDN